MKLSEKLRIYFAVTGICILPVWFCPGVIGNTFGIFLIILIIAGGVRGVRFARTLEKSIDMMSDQQQFRRILLSSREPIFKLIAQREAELSDEIEKHYSAKVEDKQSKINSLQSQINPHFLYNTLECIRSEAICQGNKSIANMAKSLASFFRYSISRRENIVTIQDELNNIQNYIMIQNYRFEDKFHFRVDMEEKDQKALSCLIPKMTIQPIVENAIFHGLETKTGESRVTVRIRMTQDKIILTISDNGVGMNEEKLKKLRYSLEHGNDSASRAGDSGKAHGNGIALYNINQRLKLTFGDEYCLNAYSIEGEGTDVEILLPIRREMEQE